MSHKPLPSFLNSDDSDFSPTEADNISPRSPKDNAKAAATRRSLDADDQSSSNARARPTISTSALDIQPPSSLHLRAYTRSPTPSSTSLSHSNLVDSASLASSAIIDDEEPNQHLPRAGTEYTNGKKSSHRLVTRFLSRTQSIRGDEPASRPKQRTGSSSQRHLSPAIRTRAPLMDENHSRLATPQSSTNLRSNFSETAHGARTAPLEPERGFRNAMNASDQRNRSADRHTNADEPRKPSVLSTTFQFGNKTFDGVRHAGGNMFKRLRQASVERQPVPVIKRQLEVIRLPLAEQARKTRLAKHYTDARDKTQFWLPSLPYRCIDYLNMHAVDEVGIYRQSGSRVEVDRFLAKFDTDPYDADLLGDPDLYDVHIVSSVFKDWLRSLPEPIIPDAVQARIHIAIKAEDNPLNCPAAMKDELSNLPPHNYYLLFAITCHISLLHSNADKNLMTFENLVTCFMRSLQVDTSIFKYLILDWRNCWQGCRTESTYLTQERNLELAAQDKAGGVYGSDTDSLATEAGRGGSSSSSRAPAAGAASSSLVEHARGTAKNQGRPQNISNSEGSDVEHRSTAGPPAPVLRPFPPIPAMRM